jgi:hypothetical protein
MFCGGPGAISPVAPPDILPIIITIHVQLKQLGYVTYESVTHCSIDCMYYRLGWLKR